MTERGAVSIEFAATLPLVAVATALVAQIGLLVSEQIAIQHAAREGARAAAVWNDDERARAAALDAVPDRSRTLVAVEPASRAVGDSVTVRVRYEPTRFPFIGRFMPAGTELVAAVSMRTERAPP